MAHIYEKSTSRFINFTLGVATLDGSADSRYSDNVILTFDKADGNLSACLIMTDWVLG